MTSKPYRQMVDLRGLFLAERSFEWRRDEIVRRLTEANLGRHHREFDAIIYELGRCVGTDSFDSELDNLYDLADEHEIWIKS